MQHSSNAVIWNEFRFGLFFKTAIVYEQRFKLRDVLGVKVALWKCNVWGTLFYNNNATIHTTLLINNIVCNQSSDVSGV